MLIAIGILREPTPNHAIYLHVEFELSSFNYFQRGTVKELLIFFMRECAQRTAIGERRSISNRDVVCHCWTNSSGLKIAVVTSEDYPPRVAFLLAMKLSDSFMALRPLSANIMKEDDLVESKEYSALMALYQDPTKADALERTSNDLDEIKAILVSTLEELCDRQQKLDDIVKKSNDLSENTKAFLVGAQSYNSCCVLF